MLKRIAIVISSMLLGGCLGSAIGWLAGRTLWFLAAELPNRHLAPEQFTMATCGLDLSIGMLTFLILMPIGFGLGVGAGGWIGIRQVNEETEMIEGEC